MANALLDAKDELKKIREDLDAMVKRWVAKMEAHRPFSDPEIAGRRLGIAEAAEDLSKYLRGAAPPASGKAREIAARVWCDKDMKDVVMDVNAAERIALIIDSVIQGKP